MAILDATYLLGTAIIVKRSLIQKEKIVSPSDPMFSSSTTPNFHFPLSVHSINE